MLKHTTELVSRLRRGDMVVATRDLGSCHACEGSLGVVFEETNAYDDGNGPMVRWVGYYATDYSQGCCNVYDGDVTAVNPKTGACVPLENLPFVI